MHGDGWYGFRRTFFGLVANKKFCIRRVQLVSILSASGRAKESHYICCKKCLRRRVVLERRASGGNGKSNSSDTSAERMPVASNAFSGRIGGGGLAVASTETATCVVNKVEAKIMRVLTYTKQWKRWKR